MDASTRKCPCCGGTGSISLPLMSAKKEREIKRDLIRKLYAEGHTMKELATMLGCRSTGTIAYYLNFKKDK